MKRQRLDDDVLLVAYGVAWLAFVVWAVTRFTSPG